MNYAAGKLQKPVTDALRALVVEDLPEMMDIADQELRAKSIEAWAYALAESSFQRVSEIPGEGNPGLATLRRGSQADHLRGVAQFAMALTDSFVASFPEVEINRDIVLSGALCHDCGKAWEFDPVNLKRWRDDPSRAGRPSLRHSVYGVHVCLAVGLPEEIAHIALAHSREGEFVGMSTECVIVRNADHLWWTIAGATGMLIPESMGGAEARGVCPRQLRSDATPRAA
jgi:23S rRNA maturation-related 3'-5' exoribonuclease YhaM